MIIKLISHLYELIGLLPFAALKMSFMQRAFLAILLLSPLCSVVGTLVIQFRMAFFSDAVAHSTFTGVAVGLLLGIDPWLAVLFFGVLTGIFAVRIKKRGELSMDTTLGVLFSSTIAFGLAVISMKKGLSKTLPGFLYGDILSINDNDIILIFCLALFSWIFLVFFYNKLLYISLNDHLARISGISVDLLETLFAALLAVIVAFAIRIVGILLVTALLVIPAAAAKNMAGNLRGQVWTAIVISLTASFCGMATSVSFDIAAGAAMILWSALFFIISMIVRGFR